MKAHYVTADVFTDRIFGGNQLAVFPEASGIDPELMPAIAREFNFSETTFVLPPSEPRYAAKVRIFTPGGELPFAGHPTVGTAHVLAELGLIRLTGGETRVLLEEGVGPVPVSIRGENGTPTFIQLSVAKLPESLGAVPDASTLASMLSLGVEDLMDADFAPECLTCGVPYLIVPLRDRRAVGRAKLNLDRWSAALRNHPANNVFVFALDGERDGSDVRARMFGPAVGVPEDPATGSAAATLGGYLAARDPRFDGTMSWRMEQGFEMGRPSIVEIEVDKSGGAVSAVRVGGSSVTVCEGSMTLPDR